MTSSLERSKQITYMGSTVVFKCDGKCTKAWGINSRPKNGEVFLKDEELQDAPSDPGTYEGGHAKPKGSEYINKWCVRECERSELRPVNLVTENDPWNLYVEPK